jgi:predicted ATPase/class 3 adenylate cyclase/Tfp pilus assembly protein PilF/tRNA A-37 threonylcarbamoyl transferase component Bud32
MERYERGDKVPATPTGQPQFLSGTYCVLFTDIEDNTHLREPSSFVTKEALARYHQILKAAVESRGGYVFKIVEATFQAIFSSASEAVQAAVAAQRVLSSEPWRTETGPLKTRMALHSCHVEARAGVYASPDFARLARLLAATQGGQILITLVTAELVQDALPEGISLVDLGERRFKDLMRPEHIYQVSASGLPDNFSPSLTLDTIPNNLPFEVSSFIGREKEISQVKRLLGNSNPASAGSRVLTLMGAGGTGKTRLALKVAAELIEAYPQGVWLVELAPLTEPGLLPQALAQPPGLTEQPGQTLLATLLAYFKTRRTLVILDNCEHLIDAVARLVDNLARNCPDLQILVTSREALGIGGEVTFQVPPLGLPNPKKMPPLERLPDYEAVQLFIERAVAAKPDWSVTNQNAAALVKLCHRLDGIPLALELAAARIRALNVEQILAKLDERFRLLTGGNRTALPRQKTLRALIDWSYDLLSEAEQIMWRRLSIFAGSWSLEAAEQLCAGENLEDFEVMDHLIQLVNKSLVVVEDNQGQTARYRFLETIRQYGEEKLRQTAEASRLEERYLAYFVQLTEEAAPQLTGGEQIPWLERLEAEHDNLRKALELCQGRGGVLLETGLQLATALWKFWEIRGYLTEGRERLTNLLAQAKSAGLDETAAYAWALNRVALLIWRQADYSAARSICEEALARMRVLDDKVGIGATLNNLANLLLEQGQVAEARQYFRESLELVRQAGDRPRIVITLTNLGVLDANQGNFVSARQLLTESLTISQELGNLNFVAQILANLGTTAIMEKDFPAADRYLEESLKTSRELNNAYFTAVILNNLGSSSVKQTRYEQALNYFLESLALSRELDLKQEISQGLVGLASLAVKKNQPGLGIELLQTVDNMQKMLGTTFVGQEKVEYEEALQACRVMLTPNHFDNLWQARQHISLEQAIARATQLLRAAPVVEAPPIPAAESDATTPVSRPGQEIRPALQLKAGLILAGTYRLEERLGSGAMGEVWLAHHILLNERRAIKIMLQTLNASPALRQRFIEGEARHSLRLESHPNIVRVYDLGLHEGMPFIVMEYVPAGSQGATLKDLMKIKSKFSVWEVDRILSQLAAALEVAHRQGLIHRDIKPTNILQDGERSNLWLKLSDFGLVKDLNSEAELTTHEQLIGTPLYMAPDQALGQPDVRSDVYSLGVLIYQLLAGQPPFSGDIPALLLQHMSVLPPPLDQIEPSVPAEVARVVMKALEKRPEDRYSSAAGMATAYHQALLDWEISQSDNTSVLPTNPSN